MRCHVKEISDQLFVFSTVRHFPSLRLKNQGTLFVSSLCRAMAAWDEGGENLTHFEEVLIASRRFIDQQEVEVFSSANGQKIPTGQMSESKSTMRYFLHFGRMNAGRH